MSGAVATGGLELYPAALGVLVASKAYGVVRSAVVPRLLPPALLAGEGELPGHPGGSAGHRGRGADRAGAAPLGPRWPLYGAFVIFVARHAAVVHAAAEGRLGQGRGRGAARS